MRLIIENIYPKAKRKNILHWLIIVISILITIVAFVFSFYNATNNVQNQFDSASARLVYDIQARLKSYENALNAGSAFLIANNYTITNKQWNLFVQNINLENNYRGVNSMTVIYPIKANELQQFEAIQLKQNNPLKVFPISNTSQKYVITYIAPSATNTIAHGLDIATAPNELEAAQLAIKTHQSQATKPIILVQDKTKNLGFVLYFPVYRNINGKNTFVAFIATSFIYSILLDKVLESSPHIAKDIEYRITNNKKIVYNQFSKHSNQLYSKTIYLSKYGTIWQIDIISSHKFISDHITYLPLYVFLGGIIINLLIILILSLMNNRTTKIAKYADNLYEELIKQANQDYLTLLPNRFALLKRLSDTIKFPKYHEIGLFCLDLDDFKIVNDTLGHDVGDELIIYIANLFKLQLRENEFIARVGGDEFFIIVVGAQVHKRCQQLATKLLAQLRNSITLKNDNVVNVGVSIGISIANFKNVLALTPASLMKESDIALHEAKLFGKNTTVFYNNVLQAKLLRTNELTHNLLNSINNQEMSLVYQPIIDVDKNHVYGFEALLRWNNNTFGSVSPTEFIPLAEKSGFIHKLGSFIFQTSITECATLIKHNILDKDIKLSINCSTIQFLKPNFVSEILHTLNVTNFNPHNLILEITESVLMLNIKETLLVLNILSNAGVILSIDDFGTGYSSLSYLNQLPVSSLKIDKSFVDLISETDNSKNLIRNIVSIANSMNLYTIAEGVENELQKQYIKSVGGRYIQGFYYSMPLTFEELSAINHFNMNTLKSRPRY